MARLVLSFLAGVGITALAFLIFIPELRNGDAPQSIQVNVPQAESADTDTSVTSSPVSAIENIRSEAPATATVQPEPADDASPAIDRESIGRPVSTESQVAVIETMLRLGAERSSELLGNESLDQAWAPGVEAQFFDFLAGKPELYQFGGYSTRLAAVQSKLC